MGPPKAAPASTRASAAVAKVVQNLGVRDIAQSARVACGEFDGFFRRADQRAGLVAAFLVFRLGV